jgi:hypothetical protein
VIAANSLAATVALWLLVINLGVAFGAGLYEHAIVVSRWIRSSPDGSLHWRADAARDDDTGRRFWAFVTTIPLTLLTVANLVAAWQASASIRGWWLAATGLTLADRLFTFSYFIPAMIRLLAAPDSPESAAAANRWRRLNYVRHAIVLAAWLTALRAFGLLHGLLAPPI